MPTVEDLDLAGLNDVPVEDLKELLRVDKAAWEEEAKDMEKHFSQFGDRLPKALANELKTLVERLKA
jgi:phosphoenolpyruvate carboxykinase (GTP)